MTDKIAPPHNREAEESVIGSVLINAESFYDAAPFIKASDFYIHRNQWIWKSFIELRRDGLEIDIVTVSDALDRAGKLAEVGGSAYLTQLIAGTLSSMNAVSYAQIIAGHAKRRKFISVANSIAQMAMDEQLDVSEIPAKVREHFETVETFDNSFVHISNPLGEIYDEIETAESDPKEVWGLPTGFTKFDKATGGIQHGDLVWWAGEPGVGKTWTLTQISIAMSGKEPGALISMEMKNKSIVRRALSGLSGIRIKAMRSGLGLPGNWRETFGDHAGSIERMPIYISDRTYTTETLRVALKNLKREYNIGWFGVDYALLFDDKAENENVRTETISRNLKHICHDLDLAGVVLQSVIKSGMDNPQAGKAKSQMRGSGQMIHDADMIVFLTKFERLDEIDDSLREDEKERIVTLHTTKGRELEVLPVEHLMRRDNSPFFDELDMDAIKAKRRNQPVIYQENE